MSKSELNNIIPPEIKDDQLYFKIMELLKKVDIKTILEIGSSSGGGSTEAFVKGILNSDYKSTIFCMEISKVRFKKLKDTYSKYDFMKFYNKSSVNLKDFPNDIEVEEFYNKYKTSLNLYPLEQVLGWLKQDKEYLSTFNENEDGISIIKKENNIEYFDMVLIDGSEFTGYSELMKIYGAKYILLDDINTFKNYNSYVFLSNDSKYELIDENRNLRNGYAIFKIKEDLPIHFFTIVLNGNPFIKYHINVFKQLPFKWHWHIIEGVADLINDTAWSLQNGAHISDELHSNGLSNDGTSEYIDMIQKEFPDNVTIYRKGNGAFWNGKLEMVNAPIANIKEECILWEIDSDELWTDEQIIRGRQIYLNNPEKTASYYFCYFFVGENKFITSVNTYGNHIDFEWLRTWRYKPGDKWISHEPPSLCRDDGIGNWIDIGKINPFTHAATQHHKLVFQHFAYVTPEQLKFKEKYYGYNDALKQWKELQEITKFPIYLKEYFEWVKDEAVVDSSLKYGIKPLAFSENNSWVFNFIKQEKTEVKKILFVRTDSIGDCILAASMLGPISKNYHDAEIDVVCQEKTSIVFKNSPFVKAVIDYNREKFKTDNNYREEILSSLKNNNYDLVLNTVYSREDVSDIISLGIGAKEIVGHNGDVCNISIDQQKINNQYYNRLISTTTNLNEIQIHKMFLDEIGIKDNNLKPEVWNDDDSQRFAELFFHEKKIVKETTIAFFPFAQHIHKEYQHYEEIIKNYPQYTFLILGGIEKVNNDNLSVWSKYKNTINLVGKTSILQLSSLIKNCVLYLGADSAGVHLACANDIPNVVLLGGGHFGRFLPYSNLTSAVIKPMECYWCNWLCKYPDVKCLWDIDINLVINAIDNALLERSDKPRIYYKEENAEQYSIIKKYIAADEFIISGINTENQNRNVKNESNTESNVLHQVNFPRISVITPNYNQADFLEQTIQSVLSQNYPNLEFIIIDGGSTDSSIDIIKKYEEYLTYWISEKDEGQYDAINKGLKIASGDIMTWINSDDLFQSNSFNNIIEAFQKNEEAEWITGRPNNTNEVGKEFYSYEYFPIYTREKFLNGLFWAPFIMQEGTFWKRSLWEKAGAYISNEYKLAGDLELWVRFFRHAKLYTLNAYLGCFRVREGQRSSEQLIEYMSEAETIINKEKENNFILDYDEVNDISKLAINFNSELPIQFGEVNGFFLTCYFLSSFQKKNRFDLSIKYFNRVKQYYKNDFKKEDYLKISILLTSLNGSELLKNALISIINQSYPNLELIVVYHDSKIENEKIIDSHKEDIHCSIKCTKTKYNEFVKLGLSKVTGEFFIWLNDDHFLEPGILLKVAEELSNKLNPIGWTGKYRLINKYTFAEEITDSNSSSLETLSHNFVNDELYIPYFMLKSEFAKRIMAEEKIHSEIFDLEFWIENLGNEKFAAFDEILVNKFIPNEEKNIVEGLNHLSTITNVENSKNQNEFNNGKIKMMMKKVEDAIQNKDYTTAIQLLQHVLSTDPTNIEALNNLSVVLSFLGENESAIRTINLVLQIDPNNEVAKDNLVSLSE